MRINVVGTSGSGKSTFARNLAKKLEVDYVELDALYWGEDWYEPDDKEFFANVKKALQKESWVVDGNYTRTIPMKWKNVDAVIWLDLPFPVTAFRAIKRAVTRVYTKQELWPGTGNRESFRRTFFSKKSVLLWTLQTYGKNREKYKAIISDQKYAHIHFVHLRSPEECQKYLDNSNVAQKFND